MTIRIRARLESAPVTSEVTATGNTLAHAVRSAVRVLGLGPGRTVSSERLDAHVHRWVWSTGKKSHTLVVTESRSGPSRESTKQKVLLALEPETVERIDAWAKAHTKGNRSAAIEAWAKKLA